MLATPVIWGRNQHHPSGSSRILGHLYDPRVCTFFLDLIKQIFTVFAKYFNMAYKRYNKKTCLCYYCIKITEIAAVSRVTFSNIFKKGVTLISWPHLAFCECLNYYKDSVETIDTFV